MHQVLSHFSFACARLVCIWRICYILPFEPQAGSLAISGRAKCMKNFIQALRFSWPYRVRVVVSIICARGRSLLERQLHGHLSCAENHRLDQNLQDGPKLPSRKPRTIFGRCKKRWTKTVRLDKLKSQPLSREREREERRIAAELARLESKLEILRHALVYFQIAKRFWMAGARPIAFKPWH